MVAIKSQRNGTGTLFCSAGLDDSELAFVKPAKGGL